MAVDCNKFSFVVPGHIFGWNLMKLGMGPLFDMLYRENGQIRSKILVEKKISKSTPNDPKREKT